MEFIDMTDEKTMINKNHINYDEPIFVFYLNIEGVSAQRATQSISGSSDNFKSLNMQCLVIPVHGKQQTRIEVLWKGNKVEKTTLTEEIAKLIENFNENPDMTTLKENVRTILLKELIS